MPIWLHRISSVLRQIILRELMVNLKGLLPIKWTSKVSLQNGLPSVHEKRSKQDHFVVVPHMAASSLTSKTQFHIWNTSEHHSIQSTHYHSEVSERYLSNLQNQGNIHSLVLPRQKVWLWRAGKHHNLFSLRTTRPFDKDTLITMKQQDFKIYDQQEIEKPPTPVGRK